MPVMRHCDCDAVIRFFCWTRTVIAWNWLTMYMQLFRSQPWKDTTVSTSMTESLPKARHTYTEPLIGNRPYHNCGRPWDHTRYMIREEESRMFLRKSNKDRIFQPVIGRSFRVGSLVQLQCLWHR